MKSHWTPIKPSPLLLPGSLQAPAGEAASPPRPASHSQDAGTPSTLSTSPGESRDWATARLTANGGGEDNSGRKRVRSGNSLPPPPPPPPQRDRLLQSIGERQGSNGAGTGEHGMTREQHGQMRRTASRCTDFGGGSPDAQANGRTGKAFCAGASGWCV